VRFIVDAQLPPALATAIRSVGHEADHVADLGLVEAEDEDIWHYAADHGAVIITKDEDFVIIHRRNAGAVVVVWLRLGNASRQRLLDCSCRSYLPLSR
jgi:predicted nuclease of predicted toxin-antitoxin system